MPQKTEAVISNKRLNVVAEHLVMDFLRKQGINVEITKMSGTILANGVPIAVKASTHGKKGFRFYTITTSQAIVRYLMCVCFDDAYEMEAFYLFPTDRVDDQDLIYLRRGGVNEKQYEKYRNNISILKK